VVLGIDFVELGDRDDARLSAVLNEYAVGGIVEFEDFTELAGVRRDRFQQSCARFSRSHPAGSPFGHVGWDAHEFDVALEFQGSEALAHR